MAHALTRRRVLGLVAASAIGRPQGVAATSPLRFGLTPVFLDNDAEVIRQLRAALSESIGAPVELVQRRTYQEVTGLLLEGALDAAWLCGYPYLQHEKALSVIGVPVWQGKPLYQSYLITAADDAATGLADLEGGRHAFSDPDSNSGWLVTASDLARSGRRPHSFFARTVFTYGHRNAVRAVASGLMRSGSVDGYVWEALRLVEPSLPLATKVIARSEWLGFPPFVAPADRISDRRVAACRAALLEMPRSEAGRKALALLRLDGVDEGDPALFEGIAARMRDLGAQP